MSSTRECEKHVHERTSRHCTKHDLIHWMPYFHLAASCSVPSCIGILTLADTSRISFSTVTGTDEYLANFEKGLPNIIILVGATLQLLMNTRFRIYYDFNDELDRKYNLNTKFNIRCEEKKTSSCYHHRNMWDMELHMLWVVFPFHAKEAFVSEEVELY